MSAVIVYTANPCPYCSRAKSLLKQRGVAFKEVELSYSDDRAWDELTKKSGMKTVPQIFFGDRLIGGYTELAELDQKNGLRSLKP